MSDNKKTTPDGSFTPPVQPVVASDRLFNLMYMAHRIRHLFIIFDECENTFEHRDIHLLSVNQQNRLYYRARDEVAKIYMSKGLNLQIPTTGKPQ